MKLRLATANRLLATLTADLAGGRLVVFEGAPPQRGLQEPLVTVVLTDFAVPVGGRAVALDIPPTVVSLSGEAGWAELTTDAGDVVADLIIRARDAADVVEAKPDILLDRVDLQRGGLFVIDRCILQLPTSGA